MTSFSERLWPTPWLFVACLLLLPAVTLMITPLSIPVAITAALLSYLGACLFLFLTSPRVELTEDSLTAGRASLPREFLGEAEVLEGDDLTLAIGPKLDARAFLLLRGWIKTGVRVINTDKNDPAPYWVITSRRADELAAAINERSRAPQESR